MAVVVFNYADWIAMFPEMSGVPEIAADGFFAIAELLVDNTDCSPITNIKSRTALLYYATAHIAALSGYPVAAGGTPTPSGLIGRVSSATEGSVSVSSEWGAEVSQSQAWWLQTQYGATYWQLTASFRTMRYVAAPPRYFGPARRAFGGPFGW